MAYELGRHEALQGRRWVSHVVRQTLLIAHSLPSPDMMSIDIILLYWSKSPTRGKLICFAPQLPLGFSTVENT